MADTNAPADLSSGTGAAPTATVLHPVSAGLTSATGVANAPKALTAPKGGLASGTGTADTLAHAGWTAATATGTGVALTPASVSPAQMYLFSPPTEQTVPPVAYEVPPLANKLFRYYSVRPRGRSIWKLPNGTFTFDQPYPTIDPRVGQIGDLDPVNAGGVGELVSTKTAVTYLYVYLGGHVYTINAVEEAALSAFLSAHGYDPDDSITIVEHVRSGITWDHPGITWDQPGLTWNA